MRKMISVRRSFQHTSKDYLVAKIIVFVLFALYVFTLFFAILWAVNASLKSQVEFNQDVNSLPKEWLFSNYVTAFTAVQANETNMFGMFWNSIWYSCGGALLTVFTSSVTSYVVAKYKFPGRNVIYAIAIITMMIPIVGSFPSQYRVYDTLKIIDSPFIIITAAAGFGFEFIVLFSFFRTLSWTYAEAGFIDGASHFKVFFRVMLPQALPVIGSLFIVAVVNRWNDYMFPTLFMQSYPTLSSGLYIFQLEMTRGINYPVLFAGLIISVIPVIVLFVCFQNRMMESMSVGGIKG